MTPKSLFTIVTAAALLMGCSSDSEETADPTPSDPTPSDTGEIPDAELMAQVAMNAAWGSNVSVSVDGDTLIITSDGLPDHGSLDDYALFGGGTAGASANPVTLELPLVPEASSAQTATSLGAIGIAVSGAVFFNPYEGDGTTVALDDNFLDDDGNPFIDDCNGHPIPDSGQYHYHGIPTCISDVIDTAGEHSRLVGYLLDGFPIYGPNDEGGAAPSDLDACLGHFGPTPEFPEGVYHYHTSDSSPYISPCYAGVVDTVMGMPAGPGPGMP